MLRLSDIRLPRRCWICVTAIIWATLAGPLAFAADNRRELWELVPKDVGLAIEVRGLSEQSRQLIGSELFQRIQRHSAWQQVLGSPEARNLREIQQTIEKTTRQSLVTWVDKLFGQDAILTLTPRKGGRPRSLLLTRMKDRDSLPEIVAAWQKLEPHDETRLQHQGRDYFRATKSGGDPLFYAQIDDILLISDLAETLLPSLELAADEQHGNSLLTKASFQKVARALHPAAAVRVVLQPGAWLGVRDESETKNPSDPVGRVMQHFVDGCQIIGVGVRQESGLAAEVVAVSDQLAQHSHWLKIVERSSGTPGFLSRVPNSAVLAFTARHDLGDIASWILSTQSPDQVKKLKSNFNDIAYIQRSVFIVRIYFLFPRHDFAVLRVLHCAF